MTQKRYFNEILPLVYKRKLEVEAEDRQFIHQEHNDDSHETRTEENTARLMKIDMNNDYIDDSPPRSSDLNPIETV